MIAIDTNLLVYACIAESPFHSQINELLRPVIEGSAAWAVPWPCVPEFIGVTSNPRIYKKPAQLARILSFVEAMMSSPHLQLLSESPGYFEKLRKLILSAKISGGRIHDARIAALCLHHGVEELWTADRDFSLFPQLKTRNPLLRPPSL